MESSRPSATPGAGTGWAAFAATLFLVLGIFNVIDGIAALTSDHHFVDDQFVAGLTFWGVVILLIGLAQLFAAYLLFSRSPSGPLLGIFLACLSLISQLFFLPAFPIWSIIIMVMDGLVIYGLTVYGEQFT
jgi:hypothetical protein